MKITQHRKRIVVKYKETQTFVVLKQKFLTFL